MAALARDVGNRGDSSGQEPERPARARVSQRVFLAIRRLQLAHEVPLSIAVIGDVVAVSS
jgi:hypothetical protein